MADETEMKVANRGHKAMDEIGILSKLNGYYT